MFSSPKFIASIGVRVVMATMASPSLVTKQCFVIRGCVLELDHPPHLSL